ncbi:MAG: PadR family transcriptional regulator [Frankiaceae bacterium]
MSIRQGLLALLAEEPRHGYWLRQEFEARTGATWPLNIGQVYTTLARLERDGLVEVTGDGDESHKVYAITPAGLAELAAWFATPVRREDRPRDELAIKLAMAAATPGVDVAGVIQAQRRDTVRALQDYTRLKVDAEPDDLAWAIVLDSLVFAAEAEVRWLDACEERLARHHAARRTAARSQRPERAERAERATEGTRR